MMIASIILTRLKSLQIYQMNEVNLRIFDICYCATAILSECFNNQVDYKIWEKIIDNLIEGYNRIDKLSEYEINDLILVFDN